jgi:nitroreductase
MDLYEVMRTTAAVRDFTDDPLPDEVLHTILDNARFAPSGGNRQGSQVVVVRDPATRERLVEITGPGARRYHAQRAAG